MSWNANDRVCNNEQEFLIAIFNPVDVILVALMREFLFDEVWKWFLLLCSCDNRIKSPSGLLMVDYQSIKSNK